LYDRIRGYKEDSISIIGYRKISKIFNEECLKTPMNKTFKPNHVHSIYKKGKIREERLNFKPIIKKDVFFEDYTSDEVDIYLKY